MERLGTCTPPSYLHQLAVNISICLCMYSVVLSAPGSHCILLQTVLEKTTGSVAQIQWIDCVDESHPMQYIAQKTRIVSGICLLQKVLIVDEVPKPAQPASQQPAMLVECAAQAYQASYEPDKLCIVKG